MCAKSILDLYIVIMCLVMAFQLSDRDMRYANVSGGRQWVRAKKQGDQLHIDSTAIHQSTTKL